MTKRHMHKIGMLMTRRRILDMIVSNVGAAFIRNSIIFLAVVKNSESLSAKYGNVRYQRVFDGMIRVRRAMYIMYCGRRRHQ
jgi:hypothetical protein